MAKAVDDSQIIRAPQSVRTASAQRRLRPPAAPHQKLPPAVRPRQSRRRRRDTCFGFDTYRPPTMQQQTTTVAHNALPPPSSTTVARSSRISVHSHIKGLGLSQDGFAASDAAGFIGQSNAREVRLILSHLVQDENQSSGSSPRPVASS